MSDKKGLFRYQDIVRTQDGTLTIGDIKGVPDITNSTIGEPAAWFLGPKAENQELFKSLIIQALDKIDQYRHDYHPEDPEVIDSDVKQSKSYQVAVSSLQNAYDELLTFIQNYTTPYFSMRYQGHMLWDNTLPALSAYFATMLHNPNNVTIQASTATTPLEILVGWDLCGMVGFPVDYEKMEQEYNPWAHITCDGSVANIESTWSQREIKFMPFALRRLMTEQKSFEYTDAQGQHISKKIDNLIHPITLKTSRGDVIGLADSKPDSWKFFNIPQDTILEIPAKIAEAYQIDDEYVVWSALVPYSLNYVGWNAMIHYIHSMDASAQMPVMIAPSTMHYSWPKAAAFNGFGFGDPSLSSVDSIRAGSLFNITVDADARMDLGILEEVLEHCLANKIPVMMVVGVTGSTEEGAVDPIQTILQKRTLFRQRGLEFSIHADAAWGGYMITGIRNVYHLGNNISKEEGNPESPTYQVEDPFVEPKDSPLNSYVYQQYIHLCKCDSITIDPHKMGYVQYPAGSILYRNGIVRRLTTFTGAYIGGTGSVDPGREPTVGIFGLEGSKPGAAAAAVYLNHRVIRPDVTGHGRLIKLSMQNTKLFALYLLALNNDNPYYQVTLLTRNTQFYAENASSDFLNMKPTEIMQKAVDTNFWDFGPDLNILDYVFNPKKSDGSLNQDVDVLNQFNSDVYDRFHVPITESPEHPLPVPIKDFPDYFLTKTTFDRSEYGDVFIRIFAERIFVKEGVSYAEIEKMNCLRSVVMDPFMPYTHEGVFFPTIIKVIDSVVRQLAIDYQKSAAD